MDDDPAVPPLSSAALIGWGMTLLAIGAALLTSGLSRRVDGDAPGLVIVAVFVLLGGWGLLTGGVVTMAQRVDRLAHERGRTSTPAP